MAEKPSNDNRGRSLLVNASLELRPRRRKIDYLFVSKRELASAKYKTKLHAEMRNMSRKQLQKICFRSTKICKLTLSRQKL